MDTNALVEGGVAGLQRIVEALEQAGVDVVGAYLIRIGAPDGSDEINLRLVTDDPGHDVLFRYVALRRAGKLPRISDEVTFTPVRPNNAEASRVLDYARQFDAPPVTLRGVGWKGVFFEDVVVVKYPEEARIVA